MSWNRTGLFLIIITKILGCFNCHLRYKKTFKTFRDHRKDQAYKTLIFHGKNMELKMILKLPPRLKAQGQCLSAKEIFKY